MSSPQPELAGTRPADSPTITASVKTPANAAIEHAVDGGAAVTTEVLTLRLGAEEYGIDILRVQEIRSFEPATRLAGAPRHVLGVTNLRGVIVPVVDLRRRFGLDDTFGPGTVTVVLGVGGRTVGAVVDSVSDVVALAPTEIKPAPEFSGAMAATNITGIATLGEGDDARMLILLDIEALMTTCQVTLAAEVTH